MSELIEIHQLDYKACSLTYGEGACTASLSGDSKCFNTYATCQDVANYSQTSKTLTFAKKQAAALPLESLQRFEGSGAEFNGSTSKVSLPAFIENDADVYEVEFETIVLNSSSSYNYYIEQAGTSSDFIYFSLTLVGNNLISRAQIGGGAGNQHMFTGVSAGDQINISFKITESPTSPLKTHFYTSLNGAEVGPLFVNSSTSSATKTDAKLGRFAHAAKIWNFKRYVNGVLLNDLPLLTDATDNTGNSTPTATDVTFNTTTIDYKAALPHIPLLDSSSTKSGELNIGARRSVSGPLGKYSSASVTMTDEAYSDNLTDPYISERTYNPLERGTFWSKFLAQNPYHEGDTYRIYNGEAGQDLASMPFKQFIVDRITAPNSGGNVSIKLVDQFRKLDPAKAVFLDLGVNKLKGDITANDIAINTTYVSGEVNDINSLQPYLKIGSEIIGIGAQTTDGVTIGFSGCTRGMFGTTAQNHSSDTLIQPCHYFYPSTVLPEATRGLYYYLQTLFNAAGINDSFLDLTGWESEISSRLYLFNDVERLITEPTNINQLIGELQRDCGFFTWFDETDKKVKLKAVVPEFPFIEIIENRDLIAGKTSHKVETTDRVTEVQTRYDVINYLGGTTGVSNYRNAFVTYGDGANPNKYGQSQVYSRETHWLQTAQQVRDSNNRILARYDDNIKFVNFSLDHTFSVRMGQVFKMTYSGFTEANGQAKTIFWQVIGLDRVDNEIKVMAQEFYLGSDFKVWGDSTTTQTYDSATSEEQETFFYWGVSKWG